MKKILFTISIAASCYAAQAQSCCSLPATEAFAQLAKNGTFVNSHFDPIPFKLENPKGHPLAFKTPDGLQGFGYEIRATKPSDKYILVIHEWWGLNDYVKQEADKLWSELGDVNVIALDMYDNKVAATRDSAAKYMNDLKTPRAEAIVNGVLAYVGKNAKIATLGWCFGGGWSLQASILAGAGSKACVMYYGMPETNKDKLKMLQAPVLGFFAEKDAWITPAVVVTFEKNLKDLGKIVTVKEYEADHAFANPSNPKFNKVAADDAHALELAFIRKYLK